MANVLSFGTHEMKEALSFFDKLNIFFYKDTILPNVVFTSSKVPLGCVTELVKMRYKLLESKEKPSKSCNPTDEMWLQFRDQAMITLKHLEEIFKHHYLNAVEHELHENAEHKVQQDT